MRPRRPRLIPLTWLALALAAGCTEPRYLGDAKPAAPPAEKKDTFIVGQRTQDIRKADAEVKQGARVVTPRITAKDPITLQGNAYVTIIGKTSMLNIQHAVDLYHATNDRYPAGYDEFMTEIIKANNIALPKLPPYQDYGYDEKEHKLVILEYPDRKDQPPGAPR